ncbi:MAG: hypothetical protein JWM91_3179 [Rhodospirillales bacterium]|nr:hypothetical protein [Rhodospirillales bacterium]
MAETIELGSIEEAKAYAVQHGGRYYVLAPETLAQIEAAEAAGGYEGGMSGVSGEGGYSAEGSGAPSSSSASDPAPGAYLDPDEYYWKAGVLIEGAIETVLGLRDLIDGMRGDPVGPVILVPKRELDKLLHAGGGDDA